MHAVIESNSLLEGPRIVETCDNSIFNTVLSSVRAACLFHLLHHSPFEREDKNTQLLLFQRQREASLQEVSFPASFTLCVKSAIPSPVGWGHLMSPGHMRGEMDALHPSKQPSPPTAPWPPCGLHDAKASTGLNLGSNTRASPNIKEQHKAC